MRPTLDIIIVNWNTRDRLLKCLNSIVTNRDSALALRRIMVVDNASRDKSMDNITELGLPLEVICNSENMGFAVACNQGAANSTADYLLFLNPDTLLVSDSLEQAITFMETPTNSNLGICGIQLKDRDGIISRSCARFPTPFSMICTSIGVDRIYKVERAHYHMSEWDHTTCSEVDHVIGAFYLIRRTLFEQLSGFDERFFVYFEDLDLSLRAHSLGWKSYYLCSTYAFHEGGGSSKAIMSMRQFYSSRSRIQYAWKHFHPWSAWAVTVSVCMIEPISRLILAAASGDRMSAKNMAIAWGKLWTYLLLNGFRK